jgi:putative glutamine amidotransferase
VVAVPAYSLEPGRVSRWWGSAAVALPMQYVAAIRRAGGRTVLLAGADGATPEDVLEPFDALLLAGGGDVDPARYGQEPHETIYGVDRDRDELEVGLVRAALLRGVPTLCVCRGMQVANVALGGTLVQHLPDVAGLADHGRPPEGPILHDVALDEGTLLRRIVGDDVVSAASHHHQAIDRLGEGLVVSGRSDDGLAESFETPEGWLIGVQWHPEETAGEDPAQQALFDAFVEAAAARRR